MEASSVPAIFYRSRPSVPAARLRLCSDDQLVERYRAGRDEAFGVIHDRYRIRLLAYVRQMLAGRSSEDVEDALQDVFERAARTLRTETAPTGLRPWLYGVAHNRCIDELRRRRPAPDDVLASSRPPAGDTTAVAERRADVDRLFRDLRALPELQRSALLMRELQGLSHAELAVALDASVPAVKSLLVRARVGLVDAEEARETPCSRIRADLAAAHDRRIKPSARASRHLRECSACRGYRAELRKTSRRLAALIPGPTLVPLGLLGRLLGGSGLHTEGPAIATGMAGSGGAAIAGAGKMVAILGAGAVLTTGAVLEQRASPDRPSAGRGHQAARAGTRPGVLRPGASTLSGGRTGGSPTAGPGSSPSPGAGLPAAPTAPASSPAGAGPVAGAPLAGALPPAGAPSTPGALAPGATDAPAELGGSPAGSGDAAAPAHGSLGGEVAGSSADAAKTVGASTGSSPDAGTGGPAGSTSATGGAAASAPSTAADSAVPGAKAGASAGGGVEHPAGSPPASSLPASGLSAAAADVADRAVSALPPHEDPPSALPAVPAKKLLGHLL
ncbi:MAG: hypothetical protein QOD61_2070 [Solirubrobacteraceae bacterium]|nr:hypothetical protein [Solirubrobacteraceae bacterium]